MSFRNSLFRDSFWGYGGTYEIVLRRLSDLYTPFDDDGNNARDMRGEPEPESRFSLDSEEIPISLGIFPPRPNPILPLSPLSRLKHGAAGTWDEKSLPPLPRMHSVPHRPPQVCEGDPRRRDSLTAVKGYADLCPRPMSRRTTRIEQNSSRVAGVSLSREVLFVMTICAAQLCVYAGIGQVLPVLRITGETFTVTNVSHLAWAVAGYTMMVGASVLVASRLGEVFGYKRIFLSGLLWSAVWSAIAGASFYSRTSLFILSRALEGSGMALCLPTGLALLGAMYPTGRRKAAIFALVAMMAPTGLIVGAVGASALTLVWWPLVYWAFTLTLLGVACFGAFTIPNAVHTNKTDMSSGSCTGNLDILGMFTGVSSLVLTGFVCIQVPMVGWQEPYLWVALICDVLLAMVFVLIERYYSPKPLVPFSAITSEVGVILGVVACGWSCFGIWIFYTWQIVQGLENVSPLLSTAYFSPVLVVGCCAVATMGLTVHRLGPYITMCVALFTFMAGSLLIVMMPITQIYWAQLFVGILLTGWGMNTCMPAATLMLSNAVDQKYHSVTSNLVVAVMFYSMALGLGAAGTVEGNVNDNGAATRGDLRGYRAAIWTGVGLAGLGFIACLGLSLSLYRRRRVRHCKCHGERSSHHQI